jgi:radical SAM superfamily enzyme YgiQ (UPF0313 family)
MNAVTANLKLQTPKGLLDFKGQKVRFSSHCCFAFDGGEIDKNCFKAIGRYLLNGDLQLAMYGGGRFFKELIRHTPELISKIKYMIEDHSTQEASVDTGIPVISPEELPASIQTVFLCETLTFPRMQMQKKLASGVNVLTPDILIEIDSTEKVIPKRAWVPFIDNIYPIEVPEIKFLPDQDLLLIDCPSRNLAFMPNGIGYVHNALKNTSVKHQTYDLDIIVYHRYHIHRLFDTHGTVVSQTGHEMPEDPWLTEAYEAWQNPETIEYFRPEIEEIIQAVAKAHPKILGLSIQACNTRFSREVVKGVKKILPDTIILVGGFSCYQSSVGLRAFPECDYMVIGEADLTIGALVEELARGNRPTGLPGVMSRFDPSDMTFEPGPLPQNLDELAFPKYEWFDLSVYRNYNHYQLTPIIASRGCRWSLCTFCAERFYWRVRSPKDVVDEFEWLAEQGCDLFMFNESDLNGKPEILLGICDEIIRRNLKVRLTGQLRIHKKCDRAFFDKLRAAGFVSLRFGVDAWSRRTLKLQLKGYTPARITQNLHDCSQAGIFTEVNTVIGVPGETDEDVDESIALIIENKPNIGRIANINPLLFVIGSVYWEEPEKYNIKFRKDKPFLYDKFTTVIPSDLWYSTDPYIDEHIRNARFEKLVLSLHDNGFPIGEMAQQVIADVKSGKGAEAHARPDGMEDASETFSNAGDSVEGATWPKSIKKESATVQTPGKLTEEPESIRQIFKYKGAFYKFDFPYDLGIENLEHEGMVIKSGSLETASNVSKALFGKIFENKGKAFYYFGRAWDILKTRGFSDLINQSQKYISKYIRQAKSRKNLVLKNGAEIQLTLNVLEDLQLITEGGDGYNILRLKGEIYGVKQGMHFNPEWVETNEDIPGTIFKGKSVREVEKRIMEYVQQHPDTSGPIQKLIVEGFNGYNIVEAGKVYYGVKQGHYLTISKAKAQSYEQGICFNGKDQSEVEAAISDFLAFNTTKEDGAVIVAPVS